jgi:elongation factor 3
MVEEVSPEELKQWVYVDESETFLFNKFEKSLALFSKKSSDEVKEAYLFTKDILMKNILNKWIMPNIIACLIPLMDISRKPIEKEYSLILLSIIAENHPKQIQQCLVELVPVVSNLFWDPKPVVQNTAKAVLADIIKCSGNADLNPFLPVVLSTFQDPSTTPDAVEKLAGCVFVQNVECAAITIIEPILNRGLKAATNEVKRKSCVIIDNMCKLVEHPKEILPLVSKIQPLVESCAENISDPEARSIANKALNTLKSSYGETKDIIEKTNEEILELISIEIKKYCTTPVGAKLDDIKYLSNIITNMCNTYYFDYDKWFDNFDKYLQSDDKQFIQNVCKNVFNKTEKSFVQKEEIYEDTEEGKDLYKGNFSLAYGALTLLNNVNIHLKRNRFYGLLGPNNCGKTTLMRAIANEQIEGFPKKEELRTIFVEHEIQEREVGEDDSGFPILNIDLCGIDWVVDCCNFVYGMQPPVKRDAVETVMEELGFGNSKKGTGKDRAADAEMQVTTYSGGWKMKMQLCAATLMNADILMLDEPTGHLDVTNIAWIKNWLRTFMDKGGSIITTSHESVFLNEMCTHIIDFQNRKLCTFKGIYGKVLEEFVQKYPEKQGYFELKNDVTKFVFPEPGVLDGVKSISKSILKMTGVSYQYPSRTEPTITDVCLECSRISRVAVIGANGAGKTTAIKVLNGELKPTAGTIIKHPNLRVAYVAQHAFHHLEKHISKTPTQYILWRFAGNEDKENLTKTESTESEMKICKYFINPKDLTELKICSTVEEEKKAVEPEYINARRDNKKLKTRDYQVKWREKPIEMMTWVTREILIKMGAILLVQRCDEKEAASAGLLTKTLTAGNIEKHLADFSIDSEQASHTQIGALSGGQKVKVVLAASLWQNPHLIILDEPTNYLDRDGLGALTKAIEEFKGGVIIISHNREFANAVAQEKWIMEAGKLRREGASIEKEEEKMDRGNKQMDDGIIKDAYGNEIKVERQLTLTASEKKTKAKKLAKQLKDGKKNNTLTDDEIYELEDQISALKDTP